MQLVTTISQKGQIVVPKKIRDKLNLNASDILKIWLEKDVIMSKPVSKPREIFGMFKTKKPITKTDIKNAYKKRIADKHL